MTPIQRMGQTYQEMYKKLSDTIIEIDQLGFDEVFLGEHYTAKPEPVSNPLQFFSSLIHQTHSIKFCTGVLNLPHHHPARLAADISMFDHMSNGRFVLGIGTGGLPSDFELFGTMEAKRGDMMLESLDAMKTIWNSNPPYEYNGTYWSFAVRNMVMEDLGLGIMHKPLQQPNPPIVVSSMMPNSGLAGLAGENEWGFISANFVTKSILKTHAESYKKGAKKSGKTPDFSRWRVVRTILVADTDEAAEAYLKSHDNNVVAYYDFLLTQMTRLQMLTLFQSDILNPVENISIDMVLDELVIRGSVKTVIGKVNELKNEIGEFGGLYLSYHDRNDNPGFWENSYQLYKNEVIPKI